MLEVPLSFPCPCGQVVNVQARRSWSVDAPEQLAKLLAGDFNRFACPHCGVVSGLAVDLIAIHHGGGWAVSIVGDDAKLDEARSALREGLPSSRARIVANRMEMIEKARIFAAGLDDVAVAIAKFQRWVLLSEAERAYKLWFERSEPDKVIFAAYTGFEKQGEVSVPLTMLERIKVACNTDQYQRHTIVDEGLARKILDLVKKPAVEQAPPVLNAIATSLMAGGVKTIQSISTLNVAETETSPAHTVHVLQRILADDRVEPWFYIVTVGLSSRPLVATSSSALARFELVALARRHDDPLLRMLSGLGRVIHDMCSSPEAAPVALGHRLAIGEEWARGWPSVLLSRFTAKRDTAVGPIDLARVTLISQEEHDELRANEDALDGAGFVLRLENRDFFALLDRWYARLGDGV